MVSRFTNTPMQGRLHLITIVWLPLSALFIYLFESVWPGIGIFLYELIAVIFILRQGNIN